MKPFQRNENGIDIALTGSGIEVESIPESTRHSPWFRAGLCLRVFFALVFTGAFIWAVVRGLDWLDVFGLAVVTLCFWVVTYAAFRGIRISNLG